MKIAYILLFIFPAISTFSQILSIEAEMPVRFGIEFGSPISWTPTVGVFGDNDPANPILMLRQGGEGVGKGIFMNSPNGPTSARIFVENNIFHLGRATMPKAISIITNGFVGIQKADPQISLHVGAGDLYVEEIGSGLIIKSPDGQCWKIVVDNSGTLSSAAVPCP